MVRIPMTPEGVQALSDELLRLKGEDRHAVIKAIASAREHGDLSENAEYHAARERQSFIEGRIAELETIISQAEAIDTSNMSGTIVRFGATVLIADEDTDEESKYRIVGVHEANISKGMISVTSPLAKALIGKTIGDSVDVQSPGGNKSYEICKITWK